MELWASKECRGKEIDQVEKERKGGEGRKASQKTTNGIFII